MGGFRFSLRNVSRVVGVVAIFIGWVLNKVADLDAVALGLLGLGLVCLGINVWQGLRFRHVVGQRTDLARDLRWQLVQSHAGFVERLRGFPFGQGHDQTALLTAFGPYGDTYGATFTYEFARASGRFAHTQEYDVVVLELPKVLPDAYLLPRDSVEAAKTLVGFDRSSFELFEFNEAWSVTGRDKPFVHSLVHPLLIDALLKIDGRVTPICCTNGALYTWTAKRLSASETRQLLQRLDDVRRSIPAFVWKDYGGTVNPRLSTIYGHGDALSRRRAEQS